MTYHLSPGIVGANPRQTFGEGIFGQWLELDRLLVQFWESDSVRSNLMYMPLDEAKQGTKDFMERLLPASTAMRITNLVECLEVGVS